MVAVGIANILCPFFGGIPATGAIARTATNIKFGAHSPISAMFHSIFVLLCIVCFSPVMSYVPMGSLAALLIFVAYNMGEPRHFMKLLKKSPRDDQIVLLSCFILTIVFDMIIGVLGGLIVSAVLFSKQMTTCYVGRRTVEDQSLLSRLAGKEMVVYEINGPLFFGTARSVKVMLEEEMVAMNSLVSSIVLIMDNVPVMDISGALSMTSGIEKILKSNKSVFIVGIRPQPLVLIRQLLGEETRGLYVLDSMATLHDAIGRIGDVPTTPSLRWIMNQKISSFSSPSIGSVIGRKQIQGDMFI